MTTNPLRTPADATSVGEWRLNGGQARGFGGTKRATAAEPDRTRVHVDITGSQERDGTTERYIGINGDIFVDAPAARKLAADLLAAADELEALAD